MEVLRERVGREHIYGILSDEKFSSVNWRFATGYRWTLSNGGWISRPQVADEIKI